MIYSPLLSTNVPYGYTKTLGHMWSLLFRRRVVMLKMPQGIALLAVLFAKNEDHLVP